MNQMLNDQDLRTVEEVSKLLEALETLKPISTDSREKRSEWIKERLQKFRYKKLKKAEKGIITRYLALMTGLNERTIKRHIKAYKTSQTIGCEYVRNKFPKTYTETDKELLAQTDNLHGRLNGKATKKILQAEYQAGNKAYQNLSQISCAHIYNLRKSRRYRDNAQTLSHTQSVQSNIGLRKKPEPEGRPGFLRVDTIHQGDSKVNRQKGLYHINLVDEVTQWQIVLAVEAISEKFLKPVLEKALENFPFQILNFHSDNGSEYINKVVCELLKKLHISQTKSRPRKSNDNALCEGKNGSTIRKHIGHWHIPKQYVPELNAFYKNYFIDYLNYYRPCAFPEKTTLDNGKIRITYPEKNYQTPLQKLASIPNLQKHLNPGIDLQTTIKNIEKSSPNTFAANMQSAKNNFLALAISP